jgi:hypothetical protein
MTKQWKKVRCNGRRSLRSHGPPPPLHHHPHHQAFVCLSMSYGTELPDTLHAQIVILHQKEDSYTEIERFLGIPQKTARAMYLKCEQDRCFSSSSRSGRPKALDERAVRNIARHITSNRDTRRQALGDITNVLHLSVCPKTLRMIITNDIGLSHRIERKKPWLSPEQKANRLHFALEHIHWAEED